MLNEKIVHKLSEITEAIWSTETSYAAVLVAFLPNELCCIDKEDITRWWEDMNFMFEW